MSAIPLPPPKPHIHPSKGYGCLSPILLFFVFLFGCREPSKHLYTIHVYNGGYWDSSVSRWECDSFEMKNSKECRIWIDGKAINFKADKYITPSKNY